MMLKIVDWEFGFCLFIGMGKFVFNDLMEVVLLESGLELIIVVLKRVEYYFDDDLFKWVFVVY